MVDHVLRRREGYGVVGMAGGPSISDWMEGYPSGVVGVYVSADVNVDTGCTRALLGIIR